LKIGILTSNKKEWHIRRITKALKNKGIDSYVFPITSLVSRIGNTPKISSKNYPIEDFDILIVRRVPGGSAEQIFYRMDTLRMLEEHGVYIINSPESIEKAVNKYYTSALLEKNSINTPKTIVVESFMEAMKAFDELGGDIILKPLFGSLGMGMTRITDKNIAYRVFRSLESIKSVYYLQEFIAHSGEDIRVFIIGGKVVAAMKRTSSSWKTNISSGGKAQQYEPTNEIINTSIKATKIIGLHYAGVDLIESNKNGLQVIELNSTPGWEGLQSVNEIDITSTLVDFILNQR
jgi:RimK family alpha-L-glutamate ligase